MAEKSKAIGTSDMPLPQTIAYDNRYQVTDLFKKDFEDVVAIKSWKKYNINNNMYKIKLNSRSEKEIKCGCVVF